MRQKMWTFWPCVALCYALFLFYGATGRPEVARASTLTPVAGASDGRAAGRAADIGTGAVWWGTLCRSDTDGSRRSGGPGQVVLRVEEESGPGIQPASLEISDPAGHLTTPEAPAPERAARESQAQPPRTPDGSGRQGAYRIVINIPAYRLSLFQGDEFVKDYPIAVGKAVSPSRIGTCTITHKVKNPTWFPPNGHPPVPSGPDNPIGSRWMGLSWPGYGIHGTNNPASIGKAVSLGCIRMRDEDARELYDIVPVGTPVEFVYQTIEVQPGDVWPGFLGARITVHRDIYRHGVNTLAHAMAALAAGLPHPAPDLDEDALKAIVAAASGKPEPVPWKPRVEVDGCFLPGAARIDAAGNVLLALRPIAEALGCYVHWDQARGVAIAGGVPVCCGVVVSGRVHVVLDDLRTLFVTVLINWDPQTLTLAISTRPAAPEGDEPAGKTPPAPPPPAPPPAPEPAPTLAPPPSSAPVPAPGPAPPLWGASLWGSSICEGFIGRIPSLVPSG